MPSDSDASYKSSIERITKALAKSENSKEDAAKILSASVPNRELIKKSINTIAASLGSIFEKSGKYLEVVTPPGNDNLIEVLYFPRKSDDIKSVNTAALRIEFVPADGIARVLKRDSFYKRFETVDSVNITEQSSIKKIEETALDFAEALASKR